MKKVKKKLLKLIPGLFVICLLLGGVGIVAYNNHAFETTDTHAASNNTLIENVNYSSLTGWYRKDGTIDIKVPYSNNLKGVSGMYSYSSATIEARSYNATTKRWSNWECLYGTGRVKTGANKAITMSSGFYYTIPKNTSKVEFRITNGTHSALTGGVSKVSTYTKQMSLYKTSAVLWLPAKVTLSCNDFKIYKTLTQ